MENVQLGSSVSPTNVSVQANEDEDGTSRWALDAYANPRRTRTVGGTMKEVGSVDRHEQLGAGDARDRHLQSAPSRRNSTGDIGADGVLRCIVEAFRPYVR